MRVLIACGGTSGHINPAIAVAGEIKRRHLDAEILFIGTENKLEADLVPRAGYKMEFIEITGISRRKNFAALKYNIKTVFKYTKARQKVKKIIKEFKPDIVFGTGGYVSAPVLSIAAAMGKKTAIHEQNAFAGVTTKMLATKVDKVFLSFPLAHPIQMKDKNCQIVGNPVKAEFLKLSRLEARQKLGIDENVPFVLSYGGSLGAKKLNQAFCVMARKSAEENFAFHYHGAARDYEFVNEELGAVAASSNINVFEYIYNMPEAMAAADLIISRSGAMTLTELAALGRASILIPSPNVTENHQYYNAKTYSDIGAAVLIEEKDLDGEKLYETVRTLLLDRSLLRKMEKAAKTLAKPNAAEKICDGLEELLS